MEEWDLIILGGGSSGLAAGIYGARSGLKTLILEEKITGGTAADAPVVENYPGFQSITGIELAQKMIEQCRKTGAAIHEFEAATELSLKDDKKIVKTSRADYQGLAVILAMGASYKQIGVPGEKEFRGRGVSYCGICDGPLFKEKHVVVVGGGNSALITALYLSDIVADVKLIHRRDTFRAEDTLVKGARSKNNIEIIWNAEVKEIEGDKLVNTILIQDRKTNESRRLQVDGVFIQAGEYPNSKLAQQAGVTVDADESVVVDLRQRTNIKGVFAAGDVTNHPVKQIGTAVGQGITAALEAYGYIRQPYYYRT